MNEQTKVAGVVLAGGLARRMQHQDKGLVHYQGEPLVSYAINALKKFEICGSSGTFSESWRQEGFGLFLSFFGF